VGRHQFVDFIASPHKPKAYGVTQSLAALAKGSAHKPPQNWEILLAYPRLRQNFDS
jgi:hypothetical protein